MPRARRRRERKRLRQPAYTHHWSEPNLAYIFGPSKKSLDNPDPVC